MLLDLYDPRKYLEGEETNGTWNGRLGAISNVNHDALLVESRNFPVRAPWSFVTSCYLLQVLWQKISALSSGVSIRSTQPSLSSITTRAIIVGAGDIVGDTQNDECTWITTPPHSFIPHSSALLRHWLHAPSDRRLAQQHLSSEQTTSTHAGVRGAKNDELLMWITAPYRDKLSFRLVCDSL
jgi:hypothetical protein